MNWLVLDTAKPHSQPRIAGPKERPTDTESGADVGIDSRADVVDREGGVMHKELSSKELSSSSLLRIVHE